MNSSDISRIDLMARSKFTYKPDVGDHWQVFSEEVKAGKPWKGDCDDLASTTIQLLFEAGADTSTLARGMVITNGGKTIDHMIAFVKDDKGVVWVVGDTLGGAYHLNAMTYKPAMISLVSEGVVWHEVKSISDIKAALKTK